MSDRLFYGGIIIACLYGVFLRLRNIFAPEFVFYDEGLYLAHNIKFLYYLDANPPRSFSQLLHFLNLSWHAALADTKIIWFFLASLRAYIFDTDAFWFTRFLSACFGIMTVWMTYLFGASYFQSRKIGLLAAGILAILPSHVFYSRSGMQESISAFFFLSALYFYVTDKKFSYRSVLSGVLFSCVFFCNYRMIVIPAILACVELILAYSERHRFRIRNFVYTVLMFFAVIFLIGAIDRGANTRITFGWMFRQAQLAEGTFSPINLLSYPFYLFNLESFAFGVLFFAGVYFVYKKQWQYCLPLAVVLIQMAIFSLPQEKGVRYLSGVFPLMALSVAACIVFFWERFKNRRLILGILVAWMVIAMGIKSTGVSAFRSSYDDVIQDLSKTGPFKASATQPVVLQILAGENNTVTRQPPTLDQFLIMYRLGYKYFILDPQAYITYTESGKRFDPQLMGFFSFIKNVVPPEKVYGHFSPHLMERFVWEHNENFKTSARFLKEHNTQKNRALYLYDIKKIIILAQHFLAKGGADVQK